MKCEICDQARWLIRHKTQVCRSCDFTRALDCYYRTKPAAIYRRNYYFGRDYFNYIKEKPALKRNFRSRLSYIRKYISRGQLLEVGSAYGYFLEEARKYFSVTGVERNPVVAEQSSRRLKVEIFGGDFEKFSHPGNTYDLVVSLDTIEHIPHPGIFIRHCASVLKKDGYLFLETGDVKSLVARLRGENWRLIHPPEHLNYFSRETIAKLLNKNGFSVIEIHSVWFWRTIMQTIFRIFPITSHLPPKMQNLFLKLIYPLNLGDLMFITARRR